MSANEPRLGEHGVSQIVTEKPMPILLGANYEHIMGQTKIVQTPESTTITISIEGKNARLVGDFVAAGEIVALSFAGVPVRPRHEGV